MTDNNAARVEDSRPVELSVLIESAARLLDEQIGEVTVTGSISGYKRSRHIAYARLVTFDPNSNQPLARIPIVFHPGCRGHSPDLNGSHVAVTGRITPHPLYGPFQLTVTSIEILDTESTATRATAELRQAIRREGLNRTNKQLRLAYDSHRFVLICPLSKGAGGADVLDRLDNSPHLWDIVTVEVSMGGPNAAGDIAAAIARHGRREVDGLLVCRGGGAPSDMAAFDSPEVAKAIVQTKVPVIVAVGHATDSHVADLVAHSSLPTPSAAADWLNQQRDTAANQARTLVVKAAEASALAKQTAAVAAHATAAQAETVASTRERQAHMLITTAVVFVVFVAAVVVLAAVLS